MKPAPFKYLRPHTLQDALAAKAAYGDDARFLAGGQSLVPTMNFRLAQPAVLIDINNVPDLDGIARDGTAIRIGARTRYVSLGQDEALRSTQPLVSEALPHIAHPQIRNRGTIGGSLAHADPASEMPAIVRTLGGRLHARSITGERWISADAFFVGALTTALTADEMLTEIELPDLPPGSGTCFMEVARRRGDFALMGVAAVVSLDADGSCAAARIGLCNAGDRPWLATTAARMLTGQRLTSGVIAEAARAAAADIKPEGSVHASAAYQRHLAGVLTRRALATALARAQETSR